MIAGGILLFIVAIELLTRGEWTFSIPRSTRMSKDEPTNMSDSVSQDTKNSFQGESGVVPPAFPLLAGPGAITAVIISYQANGLVTSILSIAIVLIITYTIFRICARKNYESEFMFIQINHLINHFHFLIDSYS